jgi:hypothetical protein
MRSCTRARAAIRNFRPAGTRRSRKRWRRTEGRLGGRQLTSPSRDAGSPKLRQSAHVVIGSERDCLQGLRAPLPSRPPACIAGRTPGNGLRAAPTPFGRTRSQESGDKQCATLFAGLAPQGRAA